MSNFKRLVQARIAKTGESWSTAARHVRNGGPSARAATAEAPEPKFDGPERILPQLYQAASQLLHRRPEVPTFVARVNSYRASQSDEIGPNGEVNQVELVDVRFTEGQRAVWYYDGALVFIEGDLYAGNKPVSLSLLDTAEGRKRLGEIIVAGMDSTFVESLALLTVKSGFKRGDNLIIVVSLAILDRQEREFGDLVVALQRADGQFSIEMSKGALKIDRALEPKRLALAKAREALRAVIAAAETPRQKKLAERALGYEKNWSRNEESLDRMEARRHGIFLPIR